MSLKPRASSSPAPNICQTDVLTLLVGGRSNGKSRRSVTLAKSRSTTGKLCFTGSLVRRLKLLLCPFDLHDAVPIHHESEAPWPRIWRSTQGATILNCGILTSSQAATLPASLGGALSDHVHPNRDHDHGADHDRLPIGVDVHQIQTVAQNAHDD